MAGKSVRADVVAGIVAGIVGLVVIVVIWVSLVFPAPVVSGGGGILRGNDIALREHEWGFAGGGYALAKGGPEICADSNNATLNIALTNTGINFHGFQVVRADTGAFVAGLNKTDLLSRGETRHIKIDVSRIAPGSYYYICPVAGHRQKGMIAPFIVQSGC
ncbi:MAG: hypothetical protein E6K12_01065 [Methanobacteriota archaeon]|nr:MAG: hypothetical protein E6K12_01065 [Euryarchaeota archaeon]